MNRIAKDLIDNYDEFMDARQDLLDHAYEKDGNIGLEIAKEYVKDILKVVSKKDHEAIMDLFKIVKTVAIKKRRGT
jgi:hypothetical protein